MFGPRVMSRSSLACIGNWLTFFALPPPRAQHSQRHALLRAMKISDQIAAVQRMNRSQLLAYVVANPHYLIDVFYKDLAEAIRQRRAELDTPSPYPRRVISR